MGFRRLNICTPNPYALPRSLDTRCWTRGARRSSTTFDLRLASRNAERVTARHRALVDSATDFAIVVADLNGVVSDWRAGAASIRPDDERFLAQAFQHRRT